MAERTRDEIDNLIADFETGVPGNISAEQLRDFLTDAFDTLLPGATFSVGWHGLGCYLERRQW